MAADVRLTWLVLAAFSLAACAKEHREKSPAPVAEARDSSLDDEGARDAGVAATAAGRGGRDMPVRENGARATAVLTPTDLHAAESGVDAIRGTATFRQGRVSVDLTVMIRGCESKAAKTYTVSILNGRDCSEETLRGAPWDGARGEDIADLQCVGTSGTGRALHSRAHDADAAWSVGGSAKTDVVGHAIAIYDVETSRPLACGVISPDVRGPAEAEAPVPPVERAAIISGWCGTQQIVHDGEHVCPKPAELVTCANDHCDVNACVEICSPYLACLAEAEDMCEGEFVCELGAACSECYAGIRTCTWNFCGDVIACAAPTSPDGPCSKLEACCALQGEKAPMCLDLVQAIKKFSGDPSCVGVMQDWNDAAQLEVPCEFE